MFAAITMKQRFILFFLCLASLIIGSSCATTDIGENQAQFLEEKILENPHIIELYMYLIDYYWNQQVNLHETLRIANECIKNNANKEQAHILAGQILLKTGNTKAGEEFLRRRIEERKNSQSLLLLAEYLRDSNQLEQAKKLIHNNWNRKDSSENSSGTALDKPSDSKEKINMLIQLELAKLDFSNKNFTAALKTLEKLFETASDTQVLNASGIMLLRIYTINDNFKQAKKLIEKMLKQVRLSEEFIELLSYIYIHNNEYHELANKLVKIYKKTQDIKLRQIIMFQLVVNEIMRDRIDDALKYVKLGLEIKPVHAPFLIFDYYLTLLKSGDKDKEIIQAKREILDSYDLIYFPAPDTFENFKLILTGNLLRYLGLLAESEGAYNKVLEDDAESIWAMLAQAELSLDMKLYNDAIYWYYKVATQTKRKSGLLCQIADCFIKLGEYNKAVDTYNSALRSFPDNKRALKGIAIAKSLNGDYEFHKDFPWIFPQD